MGAVLGISAFGRTQEKMAGANNGGASTTPTPTPPSFNAPTQSFGSASLGGNTASVAPSFSAPKPAPSFSAPAAAPAFSSTGKPMPVQPEQPEL
jgi:hypothetical protein